MICTCLLFNPKECSNCDKAFCELCIDGWLKNQRDKGGKGSCPNCNQEESTYKDMNRVIKALLNDTIVVCKCGKELKFEQLTKTHAQECLKGNIACPLQCGAEQIDDPTFHYENECPKAYINCLSCGEELQRCNV